MRIPVSTPAASRLLVFFLLSLPLSAQALTLVEAEQLALRHNALLAGARASAEAAAGDARQTALPHNPELAVARENFGNSRLTGFDGPSTTWQLSQRLELNGQHEARSEAAQQVANAAAAKLSVQQRVLLSELRTVWTEALAAQQRVALAVELTRTAEVTRVGVAAQVKAGKVSPVALSRLEVANASLWRKAQQAKVALTASRQRLTVLIGGAAADLAELDGQLPTPLPLPDLEQMLASSSANPLLREANARIDARVSERDLERANRFPDVTLSVGQRQYEKAGESAWQVGVSLPIPLFNRNQGAILAAEARLIESQALAANSRYALREEVTTLYAQVQALAEHLQRLQQRVLPASESAFSAVNKGYRFGKFGLLDVLDAQRSHVDTRFEFLDTLVDYHRQRARLDALTGIAVENTL